jgi:hypothetical protein
MAMAYRSRDGDRLDQDQDSATSIAGRVNDIAQRHAGIAAKR